MARNYNKEFSDTDDRKYAYDIDYVMRDMMMSTFSPFINGGKALELGCYNGEFTKRIAPYFSEVTVVEAASELIEEAQELTDGSVTFINDVFEKVALSDKFDAIFLSHTLEHLDDPQLVLKRIKGWLSDTGKLFLICPNANAASRQIAVNMGLIDSNQAVTAGEAEHGHRKTYSLDTLVEEASKAGLNVLDHGGVFFKPLANYQLDKALETGIIDNAFLDGCYKLGKRYPDLCASVYTICTKN